MSIWTFDSVSWTFDDEQYHWWDGLELTSDDIWSFDADHFTMDDVLHHSWDGWHDDVGAAAPAAGGGGAGFEDARPGDLVQLRLIRQRKTEDELILKVIAEFLEKAA